MLLKTKQSILRLFRRIKKMSEIPNLLENENSSSSHYRIKQIPIMAKKKHTTTRKRGNLKSSMKNVNLKNYSK